MPPGFRPQNLNDVFLAAANQTKQKPIKLTHNQEVRQQQLGTVDDRVLESRHI
jgi:hypothetical protein